MFGLQIFKRVQARGSHIPPVSRHEKVQTFWTPRRCKASISAMLFLFFTVVTILNNSSLLLSLSSILVSPLEVVLCEKVLHSQLEQRRNNSHDALSLSFLENTFIQTIQIRFVVSFSLKDLRVLWCLMWKNCFILFSNPNKTQNEHDRSDRSSRYCLCRFSTRSLDKPSGSRVMNGMDEKKTVSCTVIANVT